LSIFHPFEGRSWADALNTAGFTVWGVDLAGYGRSDRYAQERSEPAGRMAVAVLQLRRAVDAIRARNHDRPIALLGHSWGGSLAAHYAQRHPHDVKALALFAPIVARAVSHVDASAPASTSAYYTAAVASAESSITSHYPLTLWAQYRRFVEDVPRGQPQVLGEAHFQAWGAAFLATDSQACVRQPPSVMTPYGPAADVSALWSGEKLYNPSGIVAPTLLVRGEWDSVCSDADARNLLHELGSVDKTDVKIVRATHLMHLESQRGVLYNAVNTFLQRTMP
jgi:alpha-beta hydrolase superfamily lysophospholipase